MSQIPSTPFVINELPLWISWVGQDKSGAWWGYEVEPNQGDISWYENEVGNIMKLADGEINPDWLTSLFKVPK